MKQTILIVEDTPDLAQLLNDYMLLAGFQPHCLYEGSAVVDWVRTNAPGLILLDLMLPGKDGLEICREIRKFSRVPIIIVTARIEEQARLAGLDIGADDYICKPFSPREVVARVNAVLRRVVESVPTKGTVQLESDKYQAKINGKILTLTVVEFHLLAILAGEPGRVFSRNQLIDRIYNDERVVSDRTIDSHIKKLRKKINEVHDRELIYSVYSAGYKFQEN